MCGINIALKQKIAKHQTIGICLEDILKIIFNRSCLPGKEPANQIPAI